jgi:Tfp pilus tip-associated adhesin PilY1
MNLAIQAAFENYADLNTASLSPWAAGAGVPTTDGEFPLQKAQIIPSSEFQVTTPIIGTVNMAGMSDINGALLTPDPTTVKDRANNVIPQRSNLMLTAAFGLPGFDGRIRAFRMYKPVPDSTQPSGYKFQSDGTPLWTACAPGTTSSGICGPTNFPSANDGSTLGSDSRNLFTTDASGNMIAFTRANVATLASLMNLSAIDAANVITQVRQQGLGTILDSTPAIMNAPSLDPPPDDTYPGFAVAQKDRRTMVWVGTNRGIFEGIDARTGVEVWGYIPMNLLPKLRTLWDGQAVGSTDFMMDGSPKIADIKQADGSWKTMMFVSQGAGGVFYQTFDVTLNNMAASVGPTDDNLSHLLTYFSTPTVVPMKWSYPTVADWEPNCNNLGAGVCTTSPYGDLKTTATAVEKTVGQTWSDPAIGQVQGPASPYVMVAGSGFMPYSIQQQANRGGIVAGTTFYMFKAETGELLDYKSVGSDGTYETQDNCAAATNPGGTPGNDCRYFKNALHSDPVATGPSDSRFITKAYIGDLDGRLWRFDLQLDNTNKPQLVPGVGNPVKLYDDPLKQPIFASMASINISGTQYIFTGTGSDLLPSNNVSQQYRLLGIIDNGNSGTKTFEYDLVKVDNTAGDEKVTTFPAVAGDIVFFTTTTFNPASPCTLPTASLYALTFTGGAAYDTNNDGKFNNSDSVLVQSIAGARGTAPFIVDQHLVFGTAGKVQIYGNDTDYNNGIGQAGVRLLSWREVR